LFGAIIWVFISIAKLKRERKEAKIKDIELDNIALDNKIKNQQLIEMQKKNRDE